MEIDDHVIHVDVLIEGSQNVSGSGKYETFRRRMKTVAYLSKQS